MLTCYSSDKTVQSIHFTDEGPFPHTPYGWVTRELPNSGQYVRKQQRLGSCSGSTCGGFTTRMSSANDTD